MSDLIERAARVMAASCYRAQSEAKRAELADKAWRVFAQEAEAAIRELLAALREPSPAREQARLAAWRDTRPHPRTSDWLASVVEADLRAFARENGLEVPDGG